MRLIFASILFSALAACGSKSVETDLGNKPAQKGPPPYAFNAGFPDVMEFEQGLPYTYQLDEQVQVPEGTPILAIDNLPETASFDGKVLTWTPPCDLPATFFRNGYGLHYIQLTLKSSVDENQFVQRRAVLFVRQFKGTPGQKCGEK